MSIKNILQESINKNPIDFKEALEEELRSRVALALEAKMSKDEDDDEDEDDEDEDEEINENWDKGASTSNSSDRIAAVTYKRKANDAYSMAKHVGEDHPNYNKHMSDFHTANAKFVKHSYHAANYGSMSDAKKDYNYHMKQAKEWRKANKEE